MVEDILNGGQDGSSVRHSLTSYYRHLSCGSFQTVCYRDTTTRMKMSSLPSLEQGKFSYQPYTAY